MEEGRKVRLMAVGRIAAGKTSLCQRLNQEELKYRKTQTIQVVAKDMNFIDTPGEYLERRMFRGPLMVTAMQADLIVLVQSAIDSQSMFPPDFVSMFPKPAFGVITKCDKADGEQIHRAERYLRQAGAKDIFKISNVTDEGISEVQEYIDKFGFEFL